MSIITCERAVSFFPRATFCDHINVACYAAPTPAMLDAIRKYDVRGWPIDIDAHMHLETGEMAMGSVRFIADSRCWCIPIEGAYTDGLGGNGWLSQKEMSTCIDNHCNVCYSAAFRFISHAIV